MRKLQTMDAAGTHMGTQLQQVNEATSPFSGESMYVVPQCLLCITDFPVARPEMAAPFRGTFKGIIFDVGVLNSTQHGEVKVDFKLMDPSGAWVQCCALGKHSPNPMIKAQTEVACYFATGRGPIGATDGMLWVMKESASMALT